MTTVTQLPWRLGDRLARSLDHAGLKPKDMAARLHTHPNTIGNYIAGRTRIPYPTLVMWADITGVDLAWFQEDATTKGVTLQYQGSDNGLWTFGAKSYIESVSAA